MTDKTPRFENSDFNAFSSGGQPYDDKDTEKIEAYKKVLNKFKKLVEEVKKKIPHISADTVTNRASTAPGQHVKQTKFITYKWCKFYIEGYQGPFDNKGKRKLQNVFGLSINKDGLELSIDNYALGGKSGNAICCQKINSNSDFNELVNEISSYITRHFDEYIENGANLGIKECITLLNIINMKKKVLGSYNMILTGAPGTGKTYLAHKIAAAILDVTSWKEVEENASLKVKCEMVQFHPSYDYSDFVEGLRPVKDTNGNIGFERKDGVFKAFCKKALNDGYDNTEEGWKYKGEDAPKYVFIIDEINRGEMSKIFGELFFSIDPGYRGTEGRIKTQYQNLVEANDEFADGFFVPKNVYIIGTMNDIDRSVESMDFAMRRRFAFKEVRATDRESMLDEKITNATIRNEAIKRMRNVNYRIQTISGLNEAYHVGPAYFGKIEGNDFDELWNNHIKGLLNEYLRGMPNAKELLDSLERAYQKTELYVKLNNNGDLELDANKSEDWRNKIINKQ